MEDVNLDAVLPKATADAPQLKSLFATKGFTTQEMVVLSGAHCIGSSQFTEPVVIPIPLKLLSSLYVHTDSIIIFL